MLIFRGGGYESTRLSTSGLAATQLATASTTGSLQSSLESEAAERKTQDEKISKSIGSINNTLLGYIGSASTSRIGDGTLRGAIGNTSIAGIGAENNITSAISSLDANKSDIYHTHDDRYYTETEIDNIISNYSNIKKISVGTRCKTGQGNDAVVFLTNAEVNEMLGMTGCTNANTVVLAANGDGKAVSAHAEGVTYSNGVWFVTLNRNLESGALIRFNYIVIRF